MSMFLIERASDTLMPVLYSRHKIEDMENSAVPIRMSYSLQLSAALKMAEICSIMKIYEIKSSIGCFGI